MTSGRSRIGGAGLHRHRRLGALVLLMSSLVVSGCAYKIVRRVDPPQVGCIEQSDAVLLEIISGALDSHAPATAEWERRVCVDCGWDHCGDVK